MKMDPAEKAGASYVIVGCLIMVASAFVAILLLGAALGLGFGLFRHFAGG